jgi:hypothetical protein
MKITGINQNFLRVRRNAHSSCRNAIVTSSDLLFPEPVEARMYSAPRLLHGACTADPDARARHSIVNTKPDPVIRPCGNPYSTSLISSQSRLNARARLNAIERPGQNLAKRQTATRASSRPPGCEQRIFSPRGRRLASSRRSWTLLRTSRFSAASDSLPFVGREANRCAASRGFSMSTSGCGG